MRKVLAALGVALSLVLAVVPASGASAAPVERSPLALPSEAIPPSALGSCDSPGTRGGWALRDFISRGTNVDSEEIARPRNLRLGEPCLDSGEIKITSEISEVPLTDPVVTPGDASTVNCPNLQTGYTGTMVWAARDAYCVGVALPIGTGYKPDGGGGLNGGTFTITAVATTTTEYSTYNYSYDPVKPPGSPYAGGSIGIFAVCRYAGTNTWDPMDTATHAPAFYRSSGTPLTSSFTVYNSCDGKRNPSHSGGIGGGYFGTTGEAPMVIAIRNFAGTTDPTYYGPVYTALHRHASLAATAVGDINGFVSSFMTVGVNHPEFTDQESFFTCSSSRTGSTYVVDAGARYSFGDPEESSAYDYGLPLIDGETFTWSDSVLLDFNVSAVACPYLQSIRLVVCQWVAPNGPTAYACTATVWEVDLYTGGHGYPDDDPLEGICSSEVFYSEECDPILFPPYVDYGAWDLCSSPPAPAWLDFSWVPAMVLYYADCLFVPRGGWDYNGDIAGAWNGSIGGSIDDSMVELADAFTYGESCGVILNAGGTAVPIVVDTCAWSWGAPMHTLLSAALWIGFAIWAVGLFVRIGTSLINRQVANPMEGSDD